MHAQPSAAFGWEVGEDEPDEALVHIRSEADRALEAEHAPVRLGALLIVGLVYVSALTLFQEEVLEAYAGMSEARAQLGVLLLLGAATLIVLPLVGYLFHLHAESRALASAGRRYDGVVLPSDRAGQVQVAFSTPFGGSELTVRSASSIPPGSPLSVYANPQESHLVAVVFDRPSERRVRIGQVVR